VTGAAAATVSPASAMVRRPASTLFGDLCFHAIGIEFEQPDRIGELVRDPVDDAVGQIEKR
jgi:hypothetical protein